MAELQGVRLDDIEKAKATIKDLEACSTELVETLKGFLKDTEELDNCIGNKLGSTRVKVGEIEHQTEIASEKVAEIVKAANEYLVFAEEKLNA